MSITPEQRQAMRAALAHPLENRPWREWLSQALDALDAAEDRGDRLEAMVDRMAGRLVDAEDLATAVKTLRSDALHPAHLGDCAYWMPKPVGSPDRCNCGMDALRDLAAPQEDDQ